MPEFIDMTFPVSGRLTDPGEGIDVVVEAVVLGADRENALFAINRNNIVFFFVLQKISKNSSFCQIMNRLNDIHKPFVTFLGGSNYCATGMIQTPL
jgi:hypothetical protein